MRGNIPIPEIPHGEDLWLIVLITSVRERRTQQGRSSATRPRATPPDQSRLKSGAKYLKPKEIKPGLWGITGKLETFQDRSQFVVAEYRPITSSNIEHQQDRTETAARLHVRHRNTNIAGFSRTSWAATRTPMRLGNMRVEQQQRYLEDIAAEEERCYALGSLSATSGRVLSIALHAGPIPGLEFPDLSPEASEHVFGIDKYGSEEDKKSAPRLFDFHEGLRSRL